MLQRISSFIVHGERLAHQSAVRCKVSNQPGEAFEIALSIGHRHLILGESPDGQVVRVEASGPGYESVKPRSTLPEAFSEGINYLTKQEIP